jgi:RsiW-degrading membrane proteinase PrsW (M82 family)
MDDHDKSLRKAVRIYQRLLWLYPPSHRREYGPQMAQLFRDQYRAALFGDAGHRRRSAGLWLEILLDLICSAFREHLTCQINRMKNLPPKTISLILFIIATAAALVSIKLAILHANPALIVGLICFCAVALLVRAVLEWFRPVQELVRSLLWGATIAIIYALILPVFAKLHLGRNPGLPQFLALSALLNGVVPIFRAALRFLPPRG